MLRSNIVGFSDIIFLIVKLHGSIRTSRSNYLPSRLIQCRLLESSLVKFPVEELMLLLLSLPDKRWNKTDAVETFGHFNLRQLGRGREPVREIADMV